MPEPTSQPPIKVSEMPAILKKIGNNARCAETVSMVVSAKVHVGFVRAKLL